MLTPLVILAAFAGMAALGSQSQQGAGAPTKLSVPPAPPTSSSSSSSFAALTLTASQRAMIDVIAREAQAWCSARGLARARSLTAVLVANAIAESALKADAQGDRRSDGSFCSHGLFQLNVCGGVGSQVLRDNPDFTAADLHDPVVNVRGILAALAAAPKAVTALTTGTLGDAVAAFVAYVERPADTAGASKTRIALCERYSGQPRTLSCAAYDAGASSAPRLS